MRLVDEIPDDGVIIATVEIIRYLDADRDIIVWRGHDPSGAELPLVESLGMLRLTEDTAIREAMGEVVEDEDDEGEDE